MALNLLTSCKQTLEGFRLSRLWQLVTTKHCTDYEKIIFPLTLTNYGKRCSLIYANWQNSGEFDRKWGLSLHKVLLALALSPKRAWQGDRLHYVVGSQAPLTPHWLNIWSSHPGVPDLLNVHHWPCLVNLEYFILASCIVCIFSTAPRSSPPSIPAIPPAIILLKKFSRAQAVQFPSPGDDKQPIALSDDKLALREMHSIDQCKCNRYDPWGSQSIMPDYVLMRN